MNTIGIATLTAGSSSAVTLSNFTLLAGTLQVTGAISALTIKGTTGLGGGTIRALDQSVVFTIDAPVIAPLHVQSVIGSTLIGDMRSSSAALTLSNLQLWNGWRFGGSGSYFVLNGTVMLNAVAGATDITTTSLNMLLPGSTLTVQNGGPTIPSLSWDAATVKIASA